MLTKFWNNLTTQEISKLSRNTIIIAPFSAIEQHGSHLPVNTDKIILDKIIDKFCEENEKSKDFVILPNLCIGSSSEHNNFQGTLSVDSVNYINFCLNYLESVFSQKFKISSKTFIHWLGRSKIESYKFIKRGCSIEFNCARRRPLQLLATRNF